MLTTGLDGGNSTKSAALIASSTPGAGRAAAAPSSMISAAGHRRVQPDPPLLEVHGPAAARLVQHHVGLHPVIGHRQQRHPRLPPLAQPPGHRAERLARGQQRGPGDVRGEVPVAQAEPVRTNAVGRQFGQHRVGLTGPAPALLLVDAAAQRVHHGVQVRADVQAEQADVVSGVADDGDPGRGDRGLQAAQETRGADPAGQHGDSHERKSGRPPAVGPPGRRGQAGIPACPRGLSRHQRARDGPLSRIALDEQQDTRV